MTSQRRARAPEDRQRDAERSRRRLLAAALDEFAEKGYAGSRVKDIAERAGLNKQLITYYFGGKQGLYEALGEEWLRQEAELAEAEAPLEELLVSYLRAGLADPRLSRLLLWEGLTGIESAERAAATSDEDDPGVADVRRRQERGEVAEELDPGLLLVALMGALLAPIAMPQIVRRSTGLDPADPEFERRYGEQLRLIARRLA